MTFSKPRHQTPTRFPSFLFGVAYYPEHWSPDERENDVPRMVEHGVNVVRMAEFAWDIMEPEPGRYDFSLFDSMIDALGKAGIKTILCTPTAAPPRWMSEAHPDWLRVNAEGLPMMHGSRQHFCTTNPGFREASVAITRTMAQHFAQNPHVIGWQTDNEFNCHFSECYCDACKAAFQAWLKEKYTTIDRLNHAWGTAFWAQTYQSFEQIPIPAHGRPTHINPSQQLDYHRFISDQVIVFQQGQVKELRAANPAWWITHNGMFRHIDYWRFTQDLDFLSVDVYPGFAPVEDGYSWASLLNERCRAASGSFVVPEQQSGAGGQSNYLLEAPRPGQMRLWSYQSVAHGADGILHFRWRTCRYGAELYWNGVIDHDNQPRRRLAEFKQEADEFKRLGPKLLGTTLGVDVAVLIEQDQDEAHHTLPFGLPTPREQQSAIYAALLQRHIAAGLVHAEDDFDGIKVIILSGFSLIDKTLAAKLERFVSGGGILIATARCATRDRNNHVLPITPPGWMTRLFGITVEEFGKPKTACLNLHWGDDLLQQVGPGYEYLATSTAHTLATWESKPQSGPHAAAGQPAITCHAGKAIYCGLYFCRDNASWLIDKLLSLTGVASLGTAHPGVEITRRRSQDRSLLFVLNHEPTEQTATGLTPGTDLISQSPVKDRISLPPYGVAVIETD